MIRLFQFFVAFITVALALGYFLGASFARDAAFIPPDAPAAVSHEEEVRSSPKEMKPINFGVVEVGGEKNVRASMMVNDSPEPITIRSIEMIEANNGLQRLDQGCAVGKELAPGASCPVLLQWEPKTAGTVSTDLVVHHSGKIGFTVIAVRGEARETRNASPPLQQDMKKEAEKPAPPSTSRKADSASSKSKSAKSHSLGVSGLYLIGTVGDRAVFLLPSGDTCVIPTGGNVQTKDGAARLISVGAYSADIVIGGQKWTLLLKAAPTSAVKAARQVRSEDASRHKSSSRSGKNKR